MREQLYPPKGVGAPDDALKLAEEYRTFFGQAALDEFVRAHIRDEAWMPGATHRGLLELPWSDVLTTNYDTLLERAAAEINDPVYDVVHRVSDLTHARAPRIVKLHGTVRVTEDFVLAEEDYRTYPARHAAFVNFARQSFLENELCLLGFSGDDPNFLQWSGWVRDHLGSAARRIYLIGVLDLSPAKRRYLEARNVAPIDLHPAVAHLETAEQHQTAADRLIEYLAKAKPTPRHRWRPKIDEETTARRHDVFEDLPLAAKLFRQALPVWRENRLDYPGWLVAPKGVRQSLDRSLQSAPHLGEKTLSQLPADEQADVLYEAAWLHQASFAYVFPNLAKLMEPHADPRTSTLARQQALTLATTILSSAREQRDGTRFAKWAQVIEANTVDGEDARAHVAHERAIRARDQLKFDELEDLIPKIVGADPAWAFRRAALWADLDRTDRAEADIDPVLADLRRRQRMDRGSIWLRSRLAWAEWWRSALSRGARRVFNPWPEGNGDIDADPLDLIDDIRKAVEQRLKKHRESIRPYKPRFEAGVYDDNSNAWREGDIDTSAQYELLKLQWVAGAPVRVGILTVLQQPMLESFELWPGRDADDWLAIIGMARSRDDEQFDSLLGRITVARIPRQDLARLHKRVSGMAEYWWKRLKLESDSRPPPDERLAASLKVLARLSIAMPSADAIKDFEFAMKVGREIGRGAMASFREIGTLATYSAQATAPDAQGAVIDGALAFPTDADKHASEYFWPSATRWLHEVTPPAGYSPSASSVAALISRAAKGGKDRSEALLRLWFLQSHKLLGEPAEVDLQTALWSHLDEGEPPAPLAPGMLMSAIRDFPAPAGREVARLLAERLFRVEVREDPAGLQAIVNLAQTRPATGRLFPTASQARAMFDAFADWRPRTYESEFEASFQRAADQRNKRLIGRVLGLAIARALPLRDRTKARFDKLCDFLDHVTVDGAIQGLAPFLQDGRRDVIMRRLRKAISASAVLTVNSGVLTTVNWAEVWPGEAPPSELVEHIILSAERGRWSGLSPLLWGARRLLHDGHLSPAQIARLIDVLEVLLAETDYDLVPPFSLEASLVSLIRAQCVGLARELAARGRTESVIDQWREAGQSDPLPEVRYVQPISDR